jgi:lipoate-protein ligase A
MYFEIGHLNSILSQDPFYHLAMEEYLLSRLPENQIIFWVWKSSPAVILGKNQVLWKEVNLPFARQHKIRIARRISGGGTVYHDDGNVNYTMIIPKPQYKESELLHLTIRGLRQLGLNVHIQNKNALFIGKYKIGGTAFRIAKTHVLHHGTILLNANLTIMKQVLQSPFHCETRGIASRPSPVMNCNQIKPELHVESIERVLLKHLSAHFQARVKPVMPPKATEDTDFEKIYKKMKSFEWIVGESPPVFLFLHEENHGGEYRLKLKVEKGIITDVQLLSEKEIECFARFQSFITGTPMLKKHLKAVMKKHSEITSDFLYKRILEMAM